MGRIVKFVAVALAIVLGLVAAFFGAVVIAVILMVAGLLALFGQGRFKVGVNRVPPRRSVDPAPPHARGDVIDIEATKVEETRELQ